MSRKKIDELWEADRFIRKLKPVDVSNGIKLTIQLINGFELFNNVAYHNYETWSDGYRVSDRDITVEAEDLDDALKLFEDKASSKGKKNE